MSDGRAAHRESRLLRAVQTTGEGQSATTFELLFDLVYVFAITRVTAYMADAHSAPGVLRGLILLALLWTTWAGYAWLGNQARADVGLLRPGLSVAMVAIFIVDLTVLQAWHDAPGALNAPLVFVCAYLVVRFVHLGVYSVAAGKDAGLRRQIALTWIPVAASVTLLLIGIGIGGWWQTLLFAGAVVVEWVVYLLTSRRGDWRVHSAAHWTERHGLFVILTIGESILSIGFGAQGQPVAWPLLVVAVLGVALAIGLWWLYFDLVSLAAARRLEQARGQARTILAVEAYNFAHFPIVAGVVLTALGIEGVAAHAGDGDPLGVFSASALFGGLATYLAGQLLFVQRMHMALNVVRLVAVGVLLAGIALAALVPPLAALALLVLIVAALIVVDTARHSDLRRQLRGSS
ncbi:low temperature requirement protein A [Micromonospora sp. NPDC005203]|uniref:low temperature requirement protein A n=1 Tax=Micromonospora sp. NPDC005203 TaxID=3364226 RepID=UPI003684132C